MQIRRAAPQDFLQIAALDREAWKEGNSPEFIPDGEHVFQNNATLDGACYKRLLRRNGDTDSGRNPGISVYRRTLLYSQSIRAK